MGIPSLSVVQLIPSLTSLSPGTNVTDPVLSDFEFVGSDINLEQYDTLVCLFICPKSLCSHPFLKKLGIQQSIVQYLQNDDKALDLVSLLAVQPAASDAKVPSRVILAPVGSLHREIDDVRRMGEACQAAIARGKQAGGRSFFVALIDLELPLTLTKSDPVQKEVYEKYAMALPTCMLASLAESYEPLETREHFAGKNADGNNDVECIKNISFACSQELIDYALQVLQSNNLSALSSTHTSGNSGSSTLSKIVAALENGRRLCRDIGGSDPERMSPKRCAEHIKDHFGTIKSAGQVQVSSIEDLEQLRKNYPLLMAVARASLATPRHSPVVVHLEYKSPQQDKVEEELFMVGKGICYDTGGADLKVGGHMVGMSRDKCGAAALVGFMSAVASLSPVHLNVTVDLAFVRNSIGSDSYVCDEIMLSRAGKRVRIGNTDAEGRMVMTDLLAHMKERALERQDPSKCRLFTCATLTGHAARAMGPYAVTMDNGPAELDHISPRIFAAAHLFGEPFEMSRLRREDYQMNLPMSNREDLVQANSLPSVATNRGHQFPMAFMISASGLEPYSCMPGPSFGSATCARRFVEDISGKGKDNNSSCSVSTDANAQKRLAYTHLDIAGAAEEQSIGSLGRLTGVPIISLAGAFLFPSKLFRKLCH